MSFFTDQDKEYYTSLSPHISIDMSGTVFLRLKNGETIGLSAYSVADLLNINLHETRNIMKEAIRIAVTTDIKDALELSNILIGVIDLVEEGEADKQSSFPTANIPDYERQSLLSLRDIAQSLQITTDFAKQLFHTYQKPISDESDLKNFMDFVAVYLVQNHGGALPKEVRHIHVKKSKVTEQIEFTPERINTILAQEAPKELRAQTEFDKEIHIKELSNILAKLLEITPNDAGMILTSPENLQEFMYLSTLNEAEELLQHAYNGNYTPLLNIVNERIENFLQESNQAQSPTEDLIATPEAELSNEKFSGVLGQEISFSDNVIENFDSEALNDVTAGQIDMQVGNDENPYATETVAAPAEAPKSKLPETLQGQLQLCFDLRKRITSKTLAEIFKNLDNEISQTLAKFIIEDGKYGGTEGEDVKRIISQEQLDRLVMDVNNYGGLKEFIRVYLKRVNDQVHTMFYGKPAS